MLVYLWLCINHRPYVLHNTILWRCKERLVYDSASKPTSLVVVSLAVPYIMFELSTPVYLHLPPQGDNVSFPQNVVSAFVHRVSFQLRVSAKYTLIFHSSFHSASLFTITQAPTYRCT